MNDAERSIKSIGSWQTAVSGCSLLNTVFWVLEGKQRREETFKNIMDVYTERPCTLENLPCMCGHVIVH